MLLVNRLLTESTLEAAVESRHLTKELVAPKNNDTIVNCASHLKSETDLSPKKKVECRICQDEDLESLLEAPCLCRGSLKVGYTSILSHDLPVLISIILSFVGQYAHRRCVQRWCRVKGNTTCEICNQVLVLSVAVTFSSFCSYVIMVKWSYGYKAIFGVNSECKLYSNLGRIIQLHYLCYDLDIYQ